MKIIAMKTIAIILFIALLFFSCSHREKKGNISAMTNEKVLIETDSTYLFNGRDIEGWEITNFGPQGPVYISGGEIILGMGDGCTGITWKGKFPESGYKITLDAKRVSGNDFFCGMTFPVGKSPCTLIVGGWGGTVVGLSSIDKMDASENETTKLMNFDNGHWYRICLIVKDDSIKALIDDNAIVNFEIGNKNLSIRPEVDLSKPFGIASWKTTAALRNIKLERI
jgi:hypothetical protein